MMSGLDIFAWIVLIVLAASAIGVFCIAGWLPGHIAKTRRRFRLTAGAVSTEHCETAQ
jgi:hypothetical protein